MSADTTETTGIPVVLYYAGRRPNRSTTGKIAAKPIYAYARPDGELIVFSKRLPNDWQNIGFAINAEQRGEGRYIHRSAVTDGIPHPQRDEWEAADMAAAVLLREQASMRRVEDSDLTKAIDTLRAAMDAQRSIAERAAFWKAVEVKVMGR
jgi:hypothetical protein